MCVSSANFFASVDFPPPVFPKTAIFFTVRPGLPASRRAPLVFLGGLGCMLLELPRWGALVEAHFPTGRRELPDRGSQGVALESAAGSDVRRTIGEQGRTRRQFFGLKVL